MSLYLFFYIENVFYPTRNMFYIEIVFENIVTVAF
jgi:hypothetical protein